MEFLRPFRTAARGHLGSRIRHASGRVALIDKAAQSTTLADEPTIVHRGVGAGLMMDLLRKLAVEQEVCIVAAA